MGIWNQLGPTSVVRKLRRRLTGAITGVETREPVAALTFDDGPDPRWTPALLDHLSAEGARATFFMIGARAAEHPDLVRRVAAEGHAIANHSWDHPSFPLLGRRERLRQIRRCSAAIAPFGARLFRPPRGDLTLASHLDVLASRHRVVTWSVVGPDWFAVDPEALADALARKLAPGSIVLLHDGLFDALDPSFFDRSSTLAAVEILLKRLGRVYRFVTVPELLRMGRPRRKPWSKSPDPDFLSKLQVEGRSETRLAS